MKELIGKTIKQVLIGEDESMIAFVTDTGNIYFQTTEDCCSETWFSDILNIINILGTEVISAEAIELSDYNVEDGRTRQESDEAYGYRVSSAKGETTFIFRNSSNGYYGGGLAHYTRPVRSLEDFKEITVDDWKA